MVLNDIIELMCNQASLPRYYLCLTMKQALIVNARGISVLLRCGAGLLGCRVIMTMDDNLLFTRHPSCVVGSCNRRRISDARKLAHRVVSCVSPFLLIVLIKTFMQGKSCRAFPHLSSCLPLSVGHRLFCSTPPEASGTKQRQMRAH